ncbi:UNVERIFIED_CONTAM: Kinesin-like protein KIN-1 [Sesamum latifolium]|uniref:Kinesin-like protein n=1 Tax=Sesamum latifolium TaxID=2727402 RepID=A0AAW2YFX3_9LAMI
MKKNCASKMPYQDTTKKLKNAKASVALMKLSPCTSVFVLYGDVMAVVNALLALYIDATDVYMYDTDEKEEEIKFHFDRVFFQGSQQADIYEFLALPIVKGVVNGVNGAIITYGQTGAGKTYSMEGPGITECNEEQKGLLPRVVDGLFNSIKLSDDTTRYTIKLSMVEIYLERVRDLFDLSKDNLQIKESKVHGIFVSGVTEVVIPLHPSSELLEHKISITFSQKGEMVWRIVVHDFHLRFCRGIAKSFCKIKFLPFPTILVNVVELPIQLIIAQSGIANRAVGETQEFVNLTHIEMNMASSRSHCIYIFLIQQELKNEKRYGKLILVDLAGSEKAERTGAEGRVLEEAKTINKSLSALGNVINALGSPGKGNHIPYRDSKLTRILQDALGGNSQTALLCCCSPSPSNATESLSTLRFGASLRRRTRFLKASSEAADTVFQSLRQIIFTT